MVATTLRWFGATLAGLAGMVLGLTAAAVGTDSGRHVVVKGALSLANAALNGSITVESFDGSLYSGLEIVGVRVMGVAGDTVIDIENLQVRYSIRDLLTRRISLGQVTIIRPVVHLQPMPDGRLNVEHLVSSGDSAAREHDGGPSPLVAFRDVRIRDGLLVVSDSGGTETQRVEIQDARVGYLRLSSPLPGARPILLEGAQIRSRTHGLPFDFRGVRGTVTIAGDSIHADLDEVRLPNSTTTASGYLVAPSGDTRFDLQFDASQVVSADVAPFVPVIPVGLAGRGGFRVRTTPSGGVAVAGSDLALVTANSGELRGELAFVVGPGDFWSAQQVDVVTRDFDLQYLRTLLDTVPFDGRLTGRTRADGPASGLDVELHWEFRDRQARDAMTSVHGAGGVAFGDDLSFRGLRLDSADVSLATVANLVPAVVLEGRLALRGVLSGPRQDVSFEGTLRHQPTGLPASVASGRLRLDSRRDTVGVWADLAFDSLQFAGVRPSYRATPLVGAMAGQVELGGYLDSLRLRATLEGPGGRIEGRGDVVLLDTRLGFLSLDAGFERLRLDPLRDLSQSRLTGRVRGRFVADSLGPPEVDLALRLAGSVVGGTRLDSAAVRVRSGAAMLFLDSIRVWGPQLSVTGAGQVSAGQPRPDSLHVAFHVQRLGVLAPLLSRVVGREPSTPPDLISGTLHGEATFSGALDTPTVQGYAVVDQVVWGDTYVPHGEATGRWRRTPHDGFGAVGDSVRLEVDLDSLAWGDWGFSFVEGRLTSTTDTVGWFARSRVGPEAAFLAGGRLVPESAQSTIHFDSLAVLLATGVWFVQPGAVSVVTDSGVAFDNFTFRAADQGAQVAVRGRVPRRGPGQFEGRIEGLPVADLRALLQEPVEGVGGEIGGTLQLGGTARAPVIDAALQIRNFEMSEFRAPLTLGRVEYRDRRLDGTITLVRAGEEILNIDVDLPIDLALAGAGERLLPGPISIRARADGVDLGLLNAVSPQVRNTAGRFSADFGIAGSWQRPELTGYLSVADGAATFPALGVRHERLNGRIVLQGDSIRIERLALASGRGQAEIQGVVRLEGLTRPVLRLRFAAQEFRAVDIPDFLSATASGDLSLSGPVFGSTLTGRGTLTRGVLHFSDIIEKDIINLEDTAFALDSATRALIRRQGLGTEFENRFLDSLRIQGLALEMGTDFRLRSSEADIQLTGQVLVAKSGGQYRIDGTLQTPRGTYRLPLGPTIQKEFTVTRGEVRYFGTPDLNAALDIDARHLLRDIRGDPVTVFVNVGGTINSPTLTLTSDIQPALSETEIISYLVFGAPSAQAAGGGGRQVQYGLQQTVSTAAALITGQLGNALISDLGVPLDYFEIRPEFGGAGFQLAGTEIALGRRLGERWFVTLNPRICPRETFTVENVGASLEFRMSREWRLSASADPLLSCFTSAAQPSQFRYQFGVDVLWEKRY